MKFLISDVTGLKQETEGTDGRARTDRIKILSGGVEL